MKPRTKLEHLVYDLSLKTKCLTTEQKEWAYRDCLEHKAYANKTSAFCLDCGETFSLKLIKRKRATCPHCQTKLKVENNRLRTDKQRIYFALTEVIDEFQVVRNFELIAHYKKGMPVNYFLHEILQYWINPQEKVTMVGLKHTLNWHVDSWNSDWSIRKETGYWNNTKYQVYPNKYHPDSKFKSEFKKLGINASLKDISLIEAITTIPHNPIAETLIKAKQYSLLGRYVDRSGEVKYRWPSIKICLRNKYKIKDVGMYFDYLDLLTYFNKDLRNAKYVCPKDLKKEHDRLVVKKRVLQRKREIERQRKEVKQAQKQYYKDKKAFFDLMFSKGKIVIVPLKSVQEFMEEGDTLNHCLFTNKYYKKPDSLILSARIDNKPIETIEVNLKKLKIEQSRGLHNQQTEHHDSIVKLVKKNLPKIAALTNQAAA